MKNCFKIAICQMQVVDNKDQNLDKAVSMMKEAANNGAELIVLPEMFNCPYDTKKFVEYAETKEDSRSLNIISSASKDNNIYVVAGSIPERLDRKLYNSSFIIDRNGDIIGVHRKIHLFDIKIENGIEFKESDTLNAGNNVTTVDTDLIKMGVAICYDIRFPELFRLMVLDGAEIIIVPGAFNMTTGPAHWETTVRARAIDNQCYLAAASPSRNEDLSYVAYGHSLVIDPWGKTVASAGYSEEIIYAHINRELIYKVRKELPLLENRRIDIYD